MVEPSEYVLDFESGPADGMRVFTFTPPMPVRWFLQLQLDSMPEDSWWVFDREPTPEAGVRITKYEATGPIEPGINTYREVKV